MSAVRMHEHEHELMLDAELVRRLLAAQFPQWAELPVERVPSDGTENALFRLGDELSRSTAGSPASGPRPDGSTTSPGWSLFCVRSGGRPWRALLPRVAAAPSRGRTRR